MRVIKFRGKYAENRKWEYGYLTISKMGTYTIRFQLEDYTWVSSEVIPVTVGQFTGLTDKNGNDIYEGDVTKYYKSDGKTRRGIVRYNEDGFDIFEVGSYINDCSLRGLGTCGIEVIGNIHDNPELLKS